MCCIWEAAEPRWLSLWAEDAVELLAFLAVVWLGGDRLVRAALFAFRAGL